MSARKITMGLRNEYSQPPCLSLSKLRNKSKLKLCRANGDESTKKGLSPNGSDFSGSSETAVISFGFDTTPESTPKPKKDRLNEYGDGKDLIKNCAEYPCSREAPSDNKVNQKDQETQTAFLCCIDIDFLHILKSLHEGFFSRPDSDALLIDSCNGHEKAPQSLVLEDMAQLQAKVETLEKALIQLQQPESLQSNRAADKMLEQLYGPMPDYALEATGGSILATPNTQTYSSSATVSIFGFAFWKPMNSNPRLIIQGLIQPGECWTFKGTVGSVIIQLSSRITVSSITLEHFPDYLLPSGTPTHSAPKLFSVIAVPECDKCKSMLLGLFEYNLYGPARQTFIVSRELSESMPAVKIIEIHFTANHGNPVYTCVYRVRIHGEPHNI